MPARVDVIALVLLMLAAVGCHDAGSVYYENKQTGERVMVHQPPKSVAPATLSRGVPAMTAATAAAPTRAGESGGWPWSGAWSAPWSAPLTASTGQQQTRDFATESQTASLTWVGIALLLAGIGGIVARIYLPVIPLSASLLAMGAGLLFLMLPGLLGQPVLLWSILGAVAGLGLLGWLDNRTKLRAGALLPAIHLPSSPPPPTPAPAPASLPPLPAGAR